MRMNSGYIIIFSSFYKAAYAQDILFRSRIKSTVQKTPASLSMSCSYGLDVKNGDILNIINILNYNNISYGEIYIYTQNNDDNVKYKRREF